MQITYDKEADAMYLYFQKGKKVTRTIELADLLVADLDKQGKVIGVEVLCAARQIGKGAVRKKERSQNLFSMTIPMPVAV